MCVACCADGWACATPGRRLRSMCVCAEAHVPRAVPFGSIERFSPACLCAQHTSGRPGSRLMGGWVSFLCQVLSLSVSVASVHRKILPFNIEVHTSPFPQKIQGKVGESQCEHACWELIFSCYPNDPMRQEVIFPAVFQLSGTSMLQSIWLHRQGQPTGLKF